MKKLLILSDSHSDASLNNIIKNEKYNYILHAGDSQLLDTDSLISKIDYIVRGNCDFTNFEDSLSFDIKNLGKIYMTHGHLLDVKFNLDKITYFCLENNINLCVYGHTHIVHIEYLKDDDLLIINPGSTAFGRSKYKNTYIILEYSSTHYNIILKNAQNHQIIESFNYTRV